MKKVVALVFSALLGLAVANAIPAKRVYRTYTQADGSSVTAMKVGDEFGHYYVTAEGTPMLRNAQGRLQKADNEAIRAVTTRAEARKSRSYSTTMAQSSETGSKYHGIGHFSLPFPRTGKSNSLVFLVEFTDVKFTTPNPQEYFTRQLNEPGFKEDGAMGSAHDYFQEQSHGLFDPTFEVYGPVQLEHDMAYYGGNDDANVFEMIIEAVEAYRGKIDFTKYDYDNNGNIDNVFVIYAGYGEADYDDEDTVWPHAFEIYDRVVEFDGKRLYGYACANEITPPSETKPYDSTNGIATFCHEFSHVLGLPDLYNTTNPYDLTTPNAWDLMDYGSYNNDGRTPPNYSAVERNAMGWMFPAEFIGPESITLESLTKSNEAYIIPTNLDNEFFVVENRQQDGWYTYLPGHGLLVWHISFNQTIWDSNEPNDGRRGFNKGVDIVEACGFADASQDKHGNPLYLDGYSFPGSRNVTSLTSTTYPALTTWAGVALDYPITDITETDGVVSFDVCGGRIDFGEIAKPALEAFDNGTIKVTWAAHPKAVDYHLSVSCEGEPFGEYTDFSTGNVTEHIIKGVSGESDYAVKVRAVNGRQYSDYSEEAYISTPVIDFIYLVPRAISAKRESNRAHFAWEPVAGATSYALTVENEIEGGSKTETHDFGSDDVLAIPAGWEWSGRASDVYKSTSQPSALVESGAPVLKFARTGVELVSEVYASEITGLSFWLVGSATVATIKSVFTVEARATENDTWTAIHTIDNVNQYEAKGATITVDVPAGMHQLRFSYIKPAGGGNVGFDNVAVSTVARTYSKLHDRLDVGDVQNYSVDVPAGSTAVRFYVEGVDATGRYSLPSETLTVDMLSGVNDATVKNDISVDGGNVIYRGVSGDRIALVNLSGITVASATAGHDGMASIQIPSGGIYIVVSPAGSKKISAK